MADLESYLSEADSGRASNQDSSNQESPEEGASNQDSSNQESPEEGAPRYISNDLPSIFWAGAVFEHENNEGNRLDLFCTQKYDIDGFPVSCDGGYDGAEIQDNSITSLVVERGYFILAWDDPHYRGAAVFFLSSDNDINFYWVGSSWNDRISSLKTSYYGEIESSVLVKEAGRVEFIDVFDAVKALNYFVDNRPKGCITEYFDGNDKVRVCRGFSNTLDTQPSCWVAFDGSNDSQDWMTNLNLGLVRDTDLAPNGIYVTAGLDAEFQAGRSTMHDLFSRVCLDWGRLPPSEIAEFFFQGHSKGGANAILAAYYFTAQGMALTDRTNIMTTGCMKAFPLGAGDHLQRYFKSVKLYQAIEVAIQETSSYGNTWWETYGVSYDLVWDLPGAYRHLPDPMDWSSRTTRPKIIHRIARRCNHKDWRGVCDSWDAWYDDGHFVMDRWEPLGKGKCTLMDWECPPRPEWARHDFDNNYKKWIWNVAGYN